MSNRINNLRFVSAALIAAGALALGIPAVNAQSTNESPSTTGKIESGAGHAASGIGSAASSAASKATSLVTGKSDINAEILSKLHESDQAEIGIGKLADSSFTWARADPARSKTHHSGLSALNILLRGKAKQRE